MKFNLPVLLRVLPIDIRQVISMRDDLDVFFEKLEILMNSGKQYVDNFSKEPKISDDSLFFQSLVVLRSLLREVGLNVYANLLEKLSDAIVAGKTVQINHLIPKTRKSLINLFDKLARLYNHSAPKDIVYGKISDTLKSLDVDEVKRVPNILVVDDMPDVINAVEGILSPEYKVYGLVKAELVEAFLSKRRVDLFLLDIDMPNINGFDLFRIIRSRMEHKKTPILFLTSNATLDYVNSALQLGAIGYIKKPFTAEVLKTKMPTAITNKTFYLN